MGRDRASRYTVQLLTFIFYTLKWCNLHFCKEWVKSSVRVRVRVRVRKSKTGWLSNILSASLQQSVETAFSEKRWRCTSLLSFFPFLLSVCLPVLCSSRQRNNRPGAVCPSLSVAGINERGAYGWNVENVKDQRPPETYQRRETEPPPKTKTCTYSIPEGVFLRKHFFIGCL